MGRYGFIAALAVVWTFSICGISSAQNTAPDYEEVLARVFTADQEIRLRIDSLQKAGVADLQVLLPLYEEMAVTDETNRRIALPILDLYLSGEADLSDDSLQALYYVIQHSDGDVQERYRGFVYDAFRSGIISDLEYAWFADRLSVRRNEAQIYGLQCYVNMNADPAHAFPYPIAKGVEKRWRKIGFSAREMKETLSEFVGEYAPVFLGRNEFALFGYAVGMRDGIEQGVCGVDVSVNGKMRYKTGRNGFYVILLDRDEVPSEVVFVHGGRRYEVPVTVSGDADWAIVDVWL